MSYQEFKIPVNTTNDEKVVHVNLKQGIDVMKILSLEITSEDTYQLHTSGYGVIVGRVLANEAYGVPNVRVSVFVPLSSEDKENDAISTEYPYATLQTRNDDGKKYNILPDSANGGYDGKHTAMGSFPNKNEVLDNDTQREIFDKYWKFSTVTNESGDYMLFGVPTGVTQVHIDCDISDIGLLSQRPYDLVAKGYDASQFKSMTEFKTDNMENAPQIISQDKTITVFPFWGDSKENRIGITRCDVKLDYDFTPSCIFLGSCITDSVDGYINTEGVANGSSGDFNSLRTCTGDIEIIRQTENGTIEELKDNVKGIIDGNGVWCYQIPMNLDRIGMDEEGNIVQVNVPGKGIPTRTRVRFRITLSSDDNTVTTCKMLVPNNPKIAKHAGYSTPYNTQTEEEWENWYEFGEKTPECCFRNLYWNKVYSVKQYYPRIQYGPVDPIPTGQDYRHNESGRLDWTSSQRYQKYLPDYCQFPMGYGNPFNCIHSICPSNLVNTFPYNTMYAGAEHRDLYAGNDQDKTFHWFLQHLTIENKDSLIEKGLRFCFENDWINGCLYFPNVLITNGKCFNGSSSKVFITGRHNLIADNSGYTIYNSYVDKWHYFNGTNYVDVTGDSQLQKNNISIEKTSRFTQVELKSGIIQAKKNKLGLTVYYYHCGGNNNRSNFQRLYATDIINLGNLCDTLDSLPHLYEKLPTTSSTFPPLVTSYELKESGMNMDGTMQVIETMMHAPTGGDRSDSDNVDIFGNDGEDINNVNFNDYDSTFLRSCSGSADASISTSVSNYITKRKQRAMQYAQERYSLFFGMRAKLGPNTLHYLPTTFVNTSRICELGVRNDHEIEGKSYTLWNTTETICPINGIIDRFDIFDNEIRSNFASLNYDIEKYSFNSVTKYKQFMPTPMFMVDFDGRLKTYAENRHISHIDEKCDKSYIKFRYGDNGQGPMKYDIEIFSNEEFPEYDNDNYSNDPNRRNEDWRGRIFANLINTPLVLTENSFYFYFGLMSGYSALDKLRKNYCDYTIGEYSQEAVVSKNKQTSISHEIYIAFPLILWLRIYIPDTVEGFTRTNTREFGLYKVEDDTPVSLSAYTVNTFDDNGNIFYSDWRAENSNYMRGEQEMLLERGQGGYYLSVAWYLGDLAQMKKIYNQLLVLRIKNDNNKDVDYPFVLKHKLISEDAFNGTQG